MENLIEKTKKLTRLLIELQIVKEEESFQYKVKYEYRLGKDDVYSLYDSKNKKLMMDKLDRINSWLNVRNIHENVIYRLSKVWHQKKKQKS